jgi:hypothetical protein
MNFSLSLFEQMTRIEPKFWLGKKSDLLSNMLLRVTLSFICLFQLTLFFVLLAFLKVLETENVPDGN